RQFADEVKTDAYGNAVAVLNPNGDPKIMIDGHADEIGLMVKHIDDKGFVYCQRIGGVDPALIRGKRVNIHGAKGVVRGVIGAPAIHLRERGKEPKIPKLHESYVDIGVTGGDAARRRVAVGDPITFVDDFELLSRNIAVARGFDNRAGTWVAIEALRLAAAGKPKCALMACSSVQEEVGLSGAKMNVVNVRPDAALVVDVTHATDTPGIDVKQHGEVHLGKGPTLSIGRENHPVLLARLRKVAAGLAEIRLDMEVFQAQLRAKLDEQGRGYLLPAEDDRLQFSLSYIYQIRISYVLSPLTRMGANARWVYNHVLNGGLFYDPQQLIHIIPPLKHCKAPYLIVRVRVSPPALN
ncbi:hypothetical protein LCGC14_3000960, partial [marine sediment metagenome]